LELRVVAVVGLSKNCGKTTFLNWYISREQGSVVGVTTTGRDGEEIDLVTNDKKPKVKLPAGVYFTAFENVYMEKAVWVEGICKLPFRVIGKNLWLYKTLGAIETEIVGPSHLKEQESLIDIFEKYGCDTVLIDGSLDRKSICLSERVDEIVLVIGAAAGWIEEIKEQVSGIRYQVSGIRYQEIGGMVKYKNVVETNFKSIYGHENSVIDILMQQPEWVYFPGALTEYSWLKLKKYILDFKGKLVFNHPLNVRIGLRDLKEMINKKGLYSRLRFNLSCVAVNSYSPYNEHIDVDLLREEIRKMFIEKEVIDVTEVC
jgi:hypothetical protein